MTKRLQVFFIILVIFANIFTVFGQGSAGSKPSYENRRIVDMPHCGLIPLKTFAFDLTFIEQGTLYAGIDYSLFEFLSIGLSMSGTNLVGTGEIAFQKYPGLNIKGRLFKESLTMPAVAVGFSNQGFSNYFNGIDRFEVLSPGFFVVASKSFNWDLGYLAAHLGVNYSVENDSEYQSPNVYIGAEQSFASMASVHVEYNMQLDEPSKEEVALYKKGGLLNVAFRVAISDGVTFELQFRDLFNTLKDRTTIERQLNFEIVKYLGL